jgi:hypothetical protein
MVIKIIRCKFCGDALNVVRFGRYKGEQLWWCKSCRRKFTGNETIPNMRKPMVEIGSVLRMYYSGSSYKSIQSKLECQFGNCPSASTLYGWLYHFSMVAADEAEKFNVTKIGDTWVIVEKKLTICNHLVWFWDVIDLDTGFLLGSYMSRSRTAADIYKVARKAAERANKIPVAIMTSKLVAYQRGIESAFGGDTRLIQRNMFECPFEIIKRFYSSLKLRNKLIKKRRNLSNSEFVLNGWLVQYNYFMIDKSSRMTPAQKAGLNLSRPKCTGLLKLKNFLPI